MDGYGDISSLNAGLCVRRSHGGIFWSDEYCSLGSTRPAQHDTTAASVHLTDGNPS